MEWLAREMSRAVVMMEGDKVFFGNRHQCRRKDRKLRRCDRRRHSNEGLGVEGHGFDDNKDIGTRGVWNQQPTVEWDRHQYEWWVSPSWEPSVGDHRSTPTCRCEMKIRDVQNAESRFEYFGLRERGRALKVFIVFKVNSKAREAR